MTTLAIPQTTYDAARASLPNVIRSEWTKIWSVRSTMWTLIALFASTVGFSALFAWGASSNLEQMSPGERATLDVTNMSMAGLMFGQLAIAVLGALVVTSEWSTGGIKGTLTAVPDRLKVLSAKGIVFLLIALVTGLITSFASFLVSMTFWNDLGLAAGLGDAHVLRAVVGGGLYVAGSGMFGFALGTLLRHTAGAITAAIGLLFVAAPLTQLLPGTLGQTVAKYFTSNAGQHITEVISQVGALGPWTGYATFTVQWLALLVLGAWLVQRRDA
jgi:ABC-type transport system involved in multi-copper enzyme maturation permease subunit